MPQSSDSLLVEANRINYRLRSTFFYHKMKEYNVLTFSSLVANLFAVEQELLGNIRLYRGIILSNQTSLLFSSEPDISLIGRQGTTIGMIEVKGGTDPAGALERYGAAKKSFEQTLRRSPDAKTILTASCITKEVQERISQDASISYYFNLTEIITSTATYYQFMQLIFSILDETI